MKQWRAAPLSRVQTVDASQGPLEQLLGLSTLTVTTASASGLVEIVGLSRETADRVARELAGALGVAAVSWLGSLALALWLERTGRPGPMEALLQRGIYGRDPRSDAAGPTGNAQRPEDAARGAPRTAPSISRD